MIAPLPRSTPGTNTQFRAVNAINVLVNDAEALTAEELSGDSSRKRRTKRGRREPRDLPSRAEEGAGSAGGKVDEIYHPVLCVECHHRVGVLDGDEVYHFFGVIASG